MNTDKRDPEDQKKCDDIYDKFREDILKRQLSNSEGYDKAILSLSSTGLALSLTAIRFIVPLENASYLWSIKAAWILFFLTIAFTLAAYRVGNKALTTELQKAENYYIKNIANAYLEVNIYKTYNDWLNKITGVLFILAVLFVVGFVTSNLESNKMTDNKVTTKTNFLTDSADIPRMQAAPEHTFSADIPTMQMAPRTPVSNEQTNADNGNSSSNSGGTEKSG